MSVVQVRAHDPDPMGAPDFFEQTDTRGFYRPVGTVSFDQALLMCTGAMRHARARGLVDLLINVQGLSGFESPTVFMRHTMAVEWARAAGGALRVALVNRPEHMDPQKIAVLMAHNRGAAGDAFIEESAALAWLDASRLGP